MSKIQILYRGDYRYNVISDDPEHDIAAGYYYPAADVERLVEAAREAFDTLDYISGGGKNNGAYAYHKLKAALEPFNK